VQPGQTNNAFKQVAARSGVPMKTRRSGAEAFDMRSG
jgi:hypothetical protein